MLIPLMTTIIVRAHRTLNHVTLSYHMLSYYLTKILPQQPCDLLSTWGAECDPVMIAALGAYRRNLHHRDRPPCHIPHQVGTYHKTPTFPTARIQYGRHSTYHSGHCRPTYAV